MVTRGLRIVAALCLCAQALPVLAEPRDHEMAFAGESFDSIGLAVTMPFGGQKHEDSLFSRARPALTLGVAQFQPPERLCMEVCEARAVLMPTYQLNLDAIVNAAAALGSSRTLNLDLSRFGLRGSAPVDDTPAP